MCVCVCCSLERVKESDPRTNCEMEENQEFLETACLYVVAQSETFQFSLLPLSPSPTVVCAMFTSL